MTIHLVFDDVERHLGGCVPARPVLLMKMNRNLFSAHARACHSQTLALQSRVITAPFVPRVANKGLRPNSFCAFRVAVDVVLTELRRRALCSLTSLDLEAQRSAHAGLSDPSRDATAPSTTTNGCTNINNTNLAAATSVSFSERQSHCWSNVDRSLSKGKVLAALRLRASGFSGMYSPTTTWSSVYLPNKLNGRGKYTNSTGRRRRARWSPSASPVMSKMRREGFAVHDLAATVGGGYYLEPPPTGPLSSPVQVLRPGDGETGRERVCRGTEGGGAVGDSGVVGCLDQSQPALMATAPAAPFFVGFVSDDVQQVSSAGSRSYLGSRGIIKTPSRNIAAA